MKDPLYFKPELLASKGQRFANLIVDLIFRVVLMFLFGLVAGFLALFGSDGLLVWITEIGTLGEQILGWTLMLIYYTVMEATTQRTIGKYISGTKVVMEDGSKPTIGTVLLRSLCRLIPFEAFSFFGDPSRGWHDTITNTYVIDVNRYKHAEMLENSFNEIGSDINNQYNG